MDIIGNFLSLVFNVIGWVFYCFFDGFLAIVYSFFQGLDLSAVAFNMASQWSSLPTQLIWLINELAIPQCITIIIAGLGIRLILNLIPGSLSRV